MSLNEPLLASALLPSEVGLSDNVDFPAVAATILLLWASDGAAESASLALFPPTTRVTGRGLDRDDDVALFAVSLPPSEHFEMCDEPRRANRDRWLPSLKRRR